jgi:aldehyde:ferredoxin oxidoreductase
MAQAMTLGGKILDLDLSDGTWEILECSGPGIPDYIGGRGINVKHIFDNIPVGIDPLGPENILVLSCGLLTGTAAPASSRLHINALSPLTGLLGSSNVGGDFGVQLRNCGIQQLVLRGRAPGPVYLWLDADTIEIRNAKSLWGLNTWETQDYLKKNLNCAELKILTIGPGGENGTLFGCILTDRDHVAGRTGMGSVMGSKNVKAIVLRDRKVRKPFNPSQNGHEAIKRYVWQITNSPHFKEVKKFGGAGYVKWADDLGILATRNYRDFHFEDAERIDGKQLEKKVVRRRGCPRCPIQCKAELQYQEGRLKGREVVRPEFEPMLSLGSKCGLNDLETLVYLDNLCTRLGIDNISAGSSIAFAMDLFDRGIIGLEDTGGLDLSWGNGETMETLIRQMVSAEGLGAILARGVVRAAKIIGRGAERHAPHVKGLELSGYHPDNIMGTALGYAVASRGADFNDIYATMEYKWLPEERTEAAGSPTAVDLKSIHGKAELVRRSMIIGVVMDSLGLCKLPPLCLICTYDLVAEAEMVSALLETETDPSELFAAGERIVNLERLFNLKHGASHRDDRLPDMFFDKEYNAGQTPSKPYEWMEPMKQEFYGVMGWDDEGRPSPAKLAELGIDSFPDVAQPAA